MHQKWCLINTYNDLNWWIKNAKINTHKYKRLIKSSKYLSSIYYQCLDATDFQIHFQQVLCNQLKPYINKVLLLLVEYMYKITHGELIINHFVKVFV